MAPETGGEGRGLEVPGKCLLPKVQGGWACWLHGKDLGDHSRINSDSLKMQGEKLREVGEGLAQVHPAVRDPGLTSGWKSGAQGVQLGGGRNEGPGRGLQRLPPAHPADGLLEAELALPGNGGKRGTFGDGSGQEVHEAAPGWGGRRL